MNVKHPATVGHFKCVCGMHLKFGRMQGSLSITPLEHQSINGKYKVGICPGCGITHEVGDKETAKFGRTMVRGGR